MLLPFTIYRRSHSTHLAVAATSASLVGFLLVLSPGLGLAIGSLPFILWLGVTDKKNILFLFLLILPYHASLPLTQNFMGITGAKPFNLIAALMLVLFFFHHGSLARNGDAIEKAAMWYFCLYLALFSAMAIRSLSYLDLLYMVSPENFHSTSINHLLSFLVRPVLFTISFIYILKLIKTEQEINRCIDMICISVFLLSCVILVLAATHIYTVTIDRLYMTDLIQSFFHLHSNSLGSLYITCIPLLLLRAVKGQPFPLINYTTAGAAVLVLQSRSTIAIFFCGTILLLWFLKRWKTILFFSGIFLIFFLFWLPDFLVRTLLIGVESGDLNTVFTGRIDNIWLPLIREWFNSPNKLFFGVGLFSIFTSMAYLEKEMFQLGVAHNAFLQVFLDCGLVLFALFAGCVILLLKRAWRVTRQINTPTGWALFTCMITYLVGTISGGDFYPSRNSVYLFAVIALLINYFRLYLSPAQSSEDAFPNGD